MSDPVDLGDALDAIIAGLAGQFPSFRTIAAEDESRRDLPVPAIIVQFAGIDPELSSDLETGQFPARARIEARIVYGHRTPDVRREVARACAAIAAYVHENRFGVRWGAAEITAIEPDEFAPVAQNFDVWVIEWGHMVDLGPVYEVPANMVPSQLLVSWAPDIGPDNEDYYQEVAIDD